VITNSQLALEEIKNRKMVNGINPATYAGPLLSILRIMTGLLFFAHGSAKLLMFPATKNFAEGVSLFSFAGFTGGLEIVGGALITLGLLTRITAFILSGMMAVAYFMAHAPRDFYPINNGGELAILFCFIFLYIAAAGPGPWSVDARLGGRPSAARQRAGV
jgi:putative oxidoreductase